MLSSYENVEEKVLQIGSPAGIHAGFSNHAGSWVCKGWRAAGEAMNRSGNGFAGIWRRGVVVSTEEEGEEDKESVMVCMRECCLSW